MCVKEPLWSKGDCGSSLEAFEVMNCSVVRYLLWRGWEERNVKQSWEKIIVHRLCYIHYGID